MQIHNSGTTLAQSSPPPTTKEGGSWKQDYFENQPALGKFYLMFWFQTYSELWTSTSALCFPFSLPVSGSEDELYSSTSGKYILFFTLWQRSRSLFISISVPSSGGRSSWAFRCQSLYKKLEHTLRRHSSLLVSDRNGRVASKVREAS